MGHDQGGYLNAVKWNDQLTLEERIARGPFQSAFGVGRGEEAAAAVERARSDQIIAGLVFTHVKEQAIYALLSDGLSVREIAKETGIPKSEVGRTARALRDSDGHLESRPVALGPMGTDRGGLRDRIRSAWEHQ